MPHTFNADDQHFREAFERGALPTAQFNHAAHLRLAYLLLCDADVDTAAVQLRERLLRYLAHHGIDAAKYHETLSWAWLMAVRHAMALHPHSTSAAEFLARATGLLQPELLLTHYRRDTLFGEAARHARVPPDLQAFPTHA